MNPLREEDIIEALKNAPVKPSREWQRQTLTTLENLVNQENVTVSADTRIQKRETFSFLSFLFSSSYMKKAFSFLFLIAILAFGGYSYLNEPQRSVTAHLEKAQKALALLKQFAAGQDIASLPNGTIHFYPTALAEGEGEEEMVEELVDEVVSETEEAIEAAEEIDNPEETAEALEDISEVQEETLDTLSDVEEAAEEEDTIETVVEAIETTVAENEGVQDALEETQEAIENNEEAVDIEVGTTSDEVADEGEAENVAEGAEDEGEGEDAEEEEVSVRVEAAQELLAGIESEETELSPDMLKKVERIEAILEECASGGDCKEGRLHGQTTALSHKIANNARKAAKNSKDEEEGSESDGEEVVNEEGSEGEETVDEGDSAEVGNEEVIDEEITEEGEESITEEGVESENEGEEAVEGDETAVDTDASTSSGKEKGKSEDKSDNGNSEENKGKGKNK